MKKTSVTKRMLSVFLCVLMAFSAYVFAAPQSAANQTDYNYSVRVNIYVTYGCALAQESYVDLVYDGGTVRLFSSPNNKEYGDSDHIYDAEIPSFPTNVRMNAHPWWAAGKLEYCIKCYIYNYNTKSYQELAVSPDFKAQGNSDHVANLTIPDNTRPVPTEISGGIKGPDTLTLNPNGGNVSASYTVGPVRDQYGYNVKGTATLNGVTSNGVSFANGKLTADESCNRAEDYTCSIEAAYESVTISKPVTIKTFSYNVSFLDDDGTLLDKQTGLAYGESAVAPEPPVHPQTDSTVYTFKEWNGTYSNLSGVQNKSVRAVFESTDRIYTVTFKNWDGSILGTQEYKWNEVITVPSSVNPSKAADGLEYASWNFTGWSPAIGADTRITGDGMEFTALFSGTKVPYTVRFTDEQGEDIINPQILNYGQMPTVPQNVTKAEDAQYTYYFTGWDKEVAPVSESVIYRVCFGKVAKEYTVTFLAEDGSVLAQVNKQHYGAIPATFGILPENYNKAADANYHYTVSWDHDATLPIEGNTTFRIVYTPSAHTWGAWHTDKEPQCEMTGVKSRVCEACSFRAQESVPVLGHQMELMTREPTDGKNGLMYYVCANGCSRCATCVTDAQGNAAVGETCTEETLQEKTLAVPTTQFNTYYSESEHYTYNTRGAALRIDEKETENTQAMRFIASMNLPRGVEIEDYGFVCTREDKYRSLSKFVIGGKDVADISVKGGKYTDHTAEESSVRTFNLVIRIEKENWGYNYLVRPYITYNFAGVSFTVYDSMFAARSVDYVAQKIMASSSEPQFVKNYVQSKIIDR